MDRGYRRPDRPFAARLERSVAVLERARSWRVQRMLLLGVGLAARLFDAAPPDEVTHCLQRDRVCPPAD